MGIVVNEDMDIKQAKLDDIPRDMHMYSCIGKTIELLLYKGEYIEIKFSDGTYGHIANTFPISFYGRGIYNEHRERGALNITAFCYSEDGSFKEQWA